MSTDVKENRCNASSNYPITYLTPKSYASRIKNQKKLRKLDHEVAQLTQVC